MTKMNSKHLSAIYTALKGSDGMLNTQLSKKVGLANSTSSKYLCTLSNLGLIRAERLKKGNVYSLIDGVDFEKATCQSCKKSKPTSQINFFCSCFSCSRSEKAKARGGDEQSDLPGYVATTDMTRTFDGEQPDWGAVLMVATNRKINRLQMSF